ncbi:hypothetical protein EBB79_22585 (plasmid) [Parasedimentitalea marina]|uniref:Guanylate cyclase domain-containing protein n=1 Tax=Parasedimentitalea marina TaxID=2483033 RepID=A0A3T0N9L6_9RHOB|nr:adenylate/guanylate cyclase domain-containing protein [Parasedimentitalea marina]AZV80744.1 hypothetical protein EBB79_22585 [Parasedimentitalea marina]
MEFRIGINLGDIIADGEDIFGDGINIAARLEGLADPGGICLSGSAYQQARSHLGLVAEDMASKNIERPVRAYWLRGTKNRTTPKHRSIRLRRCRRSSCIGHPTVSQPQLGHRDRVCGGWNLVGHTDFTGAIVWHLLCQCLCNTPSKAQSRNQGTI